jgi:hypothetical protein
LVPVSYAIDEMSWNVGPNVIPNGNGFEQMSEAMQTRTSPVSAPSGTTTPSAVSLAVRISAMA